MKTDLQTARRNLNSPNIKTRKRALKIIKQHKKNKIIRHICFCNAHIFNF
ncbi:hypothetical protein DWB95_02170 [Staphylococcus pasteuri]|nr:hypothetical protein DWB95_02170 [Staphylococcus pasteuri]